MTALSPAVRHPFRHLSVDVRRRLMDEMPPVPESSDLAINPRTIPCSKYLQGVFYVLFAYAGLVALIQTLGSASIVLFLSPMLGAAYGVHALFPTVSVTLAFFVLFFLVLPRFKRVVPRGLGFRNGLAVAAMREERAFRAGAEDWTTGQRLKSCAIFGLMHVWNLYVPIALVWVLAAGGGYFMSVYLGAYRRTRDRDQALVEAARTHYAFNCVAIGIFLALVVAIGIIALVGLF